MGPEVRRARTLERLAARCVMYVKEIGRVGEQLVREGEERKNHRGALEVNQISAVFCFPSGALLVEASLPTIDY